MAQRFFDEEATEVGSTTSEEPEPERAAGRSRGGEQPRAFRLSTKNLLLTYPRCNLDKEEALAQLRDKFPVENIIFMVVSHELHEDGGDHLHSLVLLRARCNIRNPHALDLVNPTGNETWHGNYIAARRVRAALEYVTKDGDFTTFGECPAFLKDQKVTRAEHLDNILQIPSESEFLSYVFLNGLSPAIQTLKPLWQNAKRSRTSLSRFPADSFAVPQELADCLGSLSDLDKALMVIGPTGIGKTQCLLAHLPQETTARLTDLDDLRQITSETSVLLLDDVELGTMNRGTLLHLLDVKTERSIKCRYSNAQLRSDQSLIIVGNSIELVLGRFFEDPAVLRRIRTLHLGPDKLFRDELPLQL